MCSSITHRGLVRYLLGLAALTVGLASAPSGAQTSQETAAAISPEAAETLRRMSDYLSGLDKFRFVGYTTVDAPLDSGQSIQIGGRIEVDVRRSNRFRVRRSGDLGGQEFYYDGKRLTLFNTEENVYTHLEAPPTIEAALDMLTDKTGVAAPGADLVYRDAYAGLMEGVTVGLFLGSSEVDGKPVHHLAFRGKEVDWQIWIDSGETPLPRKYVITSKWNAGSPQFTLRLTDWETAASADDALFHFEPPADAAMAEFTPSAK
jgi:hypothetical protein